MMSEIKSATNCKINGVESMDQYKIGVKIFFLLPDA